MLIGDVMTRDSTIDHRRCSMSFRPLEVRSAVGVVTPLGAWSA
jgi:hypothetical protein